MRSIEYQKATWTRGRSRSFSGLISYAGPLPNIGDRQTNSFGRRKEAGVNGGPIIAFYQVEKEFFDTTGQRHHLTSPAVAALDIRAQWEGGDGPDNDRGSTDNVHSGFGPSRGAGLGLTFPRDALREGADWFLGRLRDT